MGHARQTFPGHGLAAAEEADAAADRGEVEHRVLERGTEHGCTGDRAGQASADMALAQLWSQGRGIQPNRVNAYVFGQLAVQQQVPQASDLLGQIEAQLPPAERSQAQQLLKQQVPITPIAHSTVNQPLSAKVEGFKVSPFGRNVFSGVSINP